MLSDTTKLFSQKVANYNNYRPSYPSSILTVLKKKCELSSSSLIVDVGSGTGKLSELFLSNGNQVIGIEPNVEMCHAGRDLLSEYSRFRNIIAKAEKSALPDQMAEFVVAGQAFHWFEPKQTFLEFTRILKPKGWIVLVWNIRQVSGRAFYEAYEDLCVEYGVSYEPQLQREPNIEVIRHFFGKNGFSEFNFENRQVFDFEGIKGRLLSSSYIPDEGDANYSKMIETLEQIFWENQKDGYINFEYKTKLFFGQMDAN